MTHGIVQVLNGDSTIQSLVGGNYASDSYKVFAVLVPDTEKPPFVVCRVSSVSVDKCKGTISDEETDTIQIDCYAGSYEDTYILYRAVRSVLDNKTTTLSDGTELYIQFSTARDFSAVEMLEVGKRDVYGITALYDAEVKLGSIT